MFNLLMVFKIFCILIVFKKIPIIKVILLGGKVLPQGIYSWFVQFIEVRKLHSAGRRASPHFSRALPSASITQHSTLTRALFLL